MMRSSKVGSLIGFDIRAIVLMKGGIGIKEGLA